MKLELRHLAPYLPYGLKAYTDGYLDTKIITLNGYDTYYDPYQINVSSVEKHGGQDLAEIKPILRPLSDLFKYEFEELSKKTGAIYDFDAFLHYLKNGYIMIDLWINLVENHFDVFGLIEKGLAIDINTLNTKTEL